MSIAYMSGDDGYSPAEVLARIFTGSGADAAAETYAELLALGDGPEGDRLRCLFEQLVTLVRDVADAYHGCLVRPDGEPMTDREIARLLCWDATTIDADLCELARVGLMTCEPLQGRFIVEGCQA